MDITELRRIRDYDDEDIANGDIVEITHAGKTFAVYVPFFNATSGIKSSGTHTPIPRIRAFDKSFTLELSAANPLLPSIRTTLTDAAEIEAAKALIADPLSNNSLTCPAMPMRLVLTWSGVECKALLHPATLREVMQTSLTLQQAAMRKSKGGWKDEMESWRWDVDAAAKKGYTSEEIKAAAKVLDGKSRPVFRRSRKEGKGNTVVQEVDGKGDGDLLKGKESIMVKRVHPVVLGLRTAVLFRIAAVIFGLALLWIWS